MKNTDKPEFHELHTDYAPAENRWIQQIVADAYADMLSAMSIPSHILEQSLKPPAMSAAMSQEPYYCQMKTLELPNSNTKGNKNMFTKIRRVFDQTEQEISRKEAQVLYDNREYILTGLSSWNGSIKGDTLLLLEDEHERVQELLNHDSQSNRKQKEEGNKMTRKIRKLHSHKEREISRQEVEILYNNREYILEEYNRWENNTTVILLEPVEYERAVEVLDKPASFCITMIREVTGFTCNRAKEVSPDEADLLFRHKDFILRNQDWYGSLSLRGINALLLYKDEYSRAEQILSSQGPKESTESYGILARDRDGSYKLMARPLDFWYDTTTGFWTFEEGELQIMGNGYDISRNFIVKRLEDSLELFDKIALSEGEAVAVTFKARKKKKYVVKEWPEGRYFVRGLTTKSQINLQFTDDINEACIFYSLQDAREKAEEFTRALNRAWKAEELI